MPLFISGGLGLHLGLGLTFALGLGLVSSGLGLGLVTLILVFNWSLKFGLVYITGSQGLWTTMTA